MQLLDENHKSVKFNGILVYVFINIRGKVLYSSYGFNTGTPYNITEQKRNAVVNYK